MDRELYSAESEQALLGAALVAPELILDELAHVQPAWFGVERHRWAWEAIRAAGAAADAVTVGRRLEDAGRLQEAGGLPFLVGLMEGCPNAYNAAGYAALVQRDYQRRQVLRLAEDLARAAHAAEDPLPAARRVLGAVDSIDAGGAGFVDAYTAAGEWFAALTRWTETGAIPGLTTGYPLLDIKTHGLKRGELAVIAARPSMGKSALAAQISYRQAKAGLRVGVFSLEMPAREWLGRQALAKLNLDYRNVSKEQLARVGEVVAEISTAPNVRFFEGGNVTAEELAQEAHQAAREMGGLDCLWVDHLGYIAHPDRHNPSYAIGRSLKVLAAVTKRLNCATVILCQLNREAARENREPQLHDLRESGEIEQDARQVWMLHRPAYYLADNVRPPANTPQDAFVLVRKNHTGPVGHIKLNFTEHSGAWSEPAQGGR